MTNPTPAHIAQTATLTDVMDMQNYAVIGLMASPNGNAALLRAPRGQIARVTPGSRAFGMTITAISADQIVLTDANGASHAMQVPR